MEDHVIGAELAGYRLVEVLGVGGMGTVYLAEDLARGGRVALKVLAPDLQADDAFRRRFLREAGYARAVEHPNVVRVIDAGLAHGAIFIAMEYVEGEDLAVLLRREGRLDPGRATRLLTQIAAAVDAVHAAGLIHRDVKPANCLVAGAGDGERALLTDFGVSRNPLGDSAALTVAGDFVGTHFYTAPEQLFGDPDPRADVYSLGCVLFECLAGRPPFVYEDVAAVLEAHVDQRPPALTEFRSDLPVALAEVVARALSKAPAGRQPTCGALIAAAGEAMGAAAGRGAGAAADGMAAAADGLVRHPAAPAPGLTLATAAGAEVEVEVELILGRGEHGFGALAGDETASRRHARVGRTARGWVVEDLGSRNGTLLNGQAITGRAPLADGDRLEVGSTVLTVRLTTEPAAPEAAGAAPTALSLRLHLDPSGRRGRVGLDAGASMRLTVDGARWHLQDG